MLSMTETSNQHENTKKRVVIRENPPPGVPTMEDQSTENIWSFSSLGCHCAFPTVILLYPLYFDSFSIDSSLLNKNQPCRQTTSILYLLYTLKSESCLLNVKLLIDGQVMWFLAISWSIFIFRDISFWFMFASVSMCVSWDILFCQFRNQWNIMPCPASLEPTNKPNKPMN